MNCFTSVNSLLSRISELGNIFHVAAYFNSREALEFLVSFCEKNDMKHKFYEFEVNNPPLLKFCLGIQQASFSSFDAAIVSNNVEIAKILLRTGYAIPMDVQDPDEVYEGLDVGGKKMDWAKEYQAPKIYRRDNALTMAVKYLAYDSIKFLLSEAETIFREHMKVKNVEPDVIDFKFEPQAQALYDQAISSSIPDNVEMIRTLFSFDKNREIDKMDEIYNRSIIHIVAGLGYIKSLKFLVEEASCNPHLVAPTNGWTPLHYAVFNSEIDTMKYLIDLPNSDIDFATKPLNHTPLMVASFYSINDAITLLLEKNANPLLTDITGDYAISYAIRAGDLSCVKLLLKHYSDKDLYIENNLGLTPFDLSVLKLQSDFYKHKVNGDTSEAKIDEDIKATYKELLGKGKNRKLPSTDEVRALTYYFLDLSNEIIERKMTGVVSSFSTDDIMSNGNVENYKVTYNRMFNNQMRHRRGKFSKRAKVNRYSGGFSFGGGRGFGNSFAF